MEKQFAISSQFKQTPHDLQAVKSVVLYLTPEEIEILRERQDMNSGILAFNLRQDDLSFLGMKDLLQTAETLKCFDQALSMLRLYASQIYQDKLKELTDSGSLVAWIHSNN